MIFVDVIWVSVSEIEWYRAGVCEMIIKLTFIAVSIDLDNLGPISVKYSLDISAIF